MWSLGSSENQQGKQSAVLLTLRANLNIISCQNFRLYAQAVKEAHVGATVLGTWTEFTWVYSVSGSCGGRFHLWQYPVPSSFAKRCLAATSEHQCCQGTGCRCLPDAEVLPHLLPPVAHDRLVLADAQLLAVHQARALRPRLVFVVWVLLQVLLAQAGLLLVVGLLL